MCFSTEASFAASLVLAVAGVATIKACPKPRLLLFAAVPLLFAVQQFSEGLIWLNHSTHFLTDLHAHYASVVFLTFAMLVWPVWIPLSLCVAESVPWRKALIAMDLVAGATLSALNLHAAMSQKVSVAIVNHSIQYLGDAPEQIFVYPLIVLIPLFVSSLKRIWVFGILTAITYTVAYYYYATAFVSVWCFFAAVASATIYWQFRMLKTQQAS